MTAWFIVGVVFVWIGLSAAVLVITCMLSARFSHDQNLQEDPAPANKVPAGDPGPAIQSRIRVIS